MNLIIAKLKSEMKNQPSILVIDDEPVICESCQRILSKEKYKVDINTNPQKGLSQALANNYDLLLLDLKMDKMDGMKLLSEFRSRKPDTPVIIFTGYPSKESKEESNKLNVSNYILKPFLPQEILDPVNKIIRQTDTTKKENFKSQTRIIKKIDGEHSRTNYRFFKSGWQYKQSNGFIKVGGIFPKLIDGTIESIRSHDTDSIIYQGLPLAEVTLRNKTKYIIPSAVTGKVLEINSNLIKNPSLIETNDFTRCWIANIEPVIAEENFINISEIRNIIFFSKDDYNNNEYCEHFKNLGCVVYRASSIASVIEILTEVQVEILIIDSISLFNSGPDYAELINEKFPDVKIVVFDNIDFALESQYRKNKVFYYALHPISYNEISDLLYSAFHLSQKEEIIEYKKSNFHLQIINHPQIINRICTTNTQGKNVILITFEDLLSANKGIGRRLIRNLLNKSYPIEVDHTWDLDPRTEYVRVKKVLQALEKCERLVILKSENINKIPGSILVDNHIVESVNKPDKSLITITIQPEESSKGICFDPITAKSLADIIEFELTGD